MAVKQIGTDKALVTVIDDFQTATEIVQQLRICGFPENNIELVTHDVHEVAPEIETPKVHETTTSAFIDNAAKWGAIGASAGAVVGLITPFPGVGLGMIIIGGLTGAAVGGMAGIGHAIDDDSVNLPTIDEYEAVVNNGATLVVFQGTHNEVLRAENVIKKMYSVRSHIHPVHGHEYHEHPMRDIPRA